MQNMKHSILFFIGVFAVFFSVPHSVQECSAQTRVERAWEQFAKQTPLPPQRNVIQETWERYVRKIPVPASAKYPGRTVGEEASLAGFMERSIWRHRATSYELYFASSRELARSVYGLAIQSGDVDSSMALERFEKGVRGFHYSAPQVCEWVNAVLGGLSPIQTDEERQILLWLLKDGVVDIVNGKAQPAGGINHVLGAAPGKNRKFETTLRHERFHVLWDEDPELADTAKKEWAALTEAEKKEIRKTLAAYAQNNEAQLMEEWAIFKAENMPDAQRKPLVGL